MLFKISWHRCDNISGVPGFVLAFSVVVKVTEGLSFVSHLAILNLIL
jgi:hypothetical protein